MKLGAYDYLYSLLDRLDMPADFERMVRKAKVFEMNDAASAAAQARVSDKTEHEIYLWTCDDLTLPFPVVALSAKTFCTVIEAEEGFGIQRRWKFIHVKRTATGNTDGVVYYGELNTIVPTIYEGQDSFAIDSNRIWAADIEGSGVVTMRITNDITRAVPTMAQYCHTMLQDVISMLRVLGVFSLPDLSIVEVTSLNKKTRKRRKAAGLRDMPTYTVLYPDRARRLMGVEIPASETSGKRRVRDRRGHWRRAHTRVLRAEKWKESQGKVVEIDKTWVHSVWCGPSEAENNGHRYRIVLDNET